jgi:hypothetical protein
MAEFLSLGSTRWIGFIAVLRLDSRNFFKFENSAPDKADKSGLLAGIPIAESY